MKQQLLTISVNTRYRVIFACLYWKSQGISCGLESGQPADICVPENGSGFMAPVSVLCVMGISCHDGPKISQTSHTDADVLKI